MRWTLLQAAHTWLFILCSDFRSELVHVPNSQHKQSLEIKRLRTAEFSLKLLVEQCIILPVQLTDYTDASSDYLVLPTVPSLKIPVSQEGDVTSGSTCKPLSGNLWLHLWLEKCHGSLLLLDPQISFLAWTLCGQKETPQWLQSRTHGQNYRVNNLPFFVLIWHTDEVASGKFNLSSLF